MQKSKLLALAVAGVIVGGTKVVSAQTPISLFTTEADWGGSWTINSTPTTGTQSGWAGWGVTAGTYVPASVDGGAPMGQGTSASSLAISPTETVTFNGPDLDGSTINGLGNYNNDNDPGTGGPDDTVGGPGPGLGNYTGTSFVGYAGQKSAGGSLTIHNYAGGFDTITTGQMLQGGTATGNAAFLNALYQTNGSGILKVDFTSPLGGTTVSTASGFPYFLIGFLVYSNNASYASGWVNAPAGFTATNPDPGAFGDAPGAYEVNHGTYWTGYIPYSNILPPSDYTNASFGLIVNSGTGGTTNPYVGNFTIDNVEVLPVTAGPTSTWVPSGGGSASWATLANWTNLSVIPNALGSTAIFGQTSAAASVTMDVAASGTNWVLGNINFNNSSGYTFNIRSKTTLNKNGGLTIDNGPVPANITDNAGTQTFNIPIQLNSLATLNIVNGGDALVFNNTISGTGGLEVIGSGSITLNSSNTYTGITNINGGNVNVTAANAFSPSTNLSIGNFNVTSSLIFSPNLGTFTVGNLILDDPTNLTVDISNDTLVIAYAAAGTGSQFNNIATGIGENVTGNGGGIQASNPGNSNTLEAVDNGSSITITSAPQVVSANISGSGAFQAIGTGTLTLASPSNTYTGATNLEGGTINVTTFGALPAGTALTIGDPTGTFSTKVTLSKGLGNIALSNLTINDATSTSSGITTTLDIATNILTVNYAAAGNPDPLTGLQEAIAANEVLAGEGTGDTPFVVGTTSANLPKGYGYGLYDNGSTLALGRTLIGDLNVDGSVNLTDLLALLNSYGQTGQAWQTGDTNGDGSVNLTDLLALLNNYGEKSNVGLSFSGQQVVPEPASMSLLGLGAAGLLSRRRRRA